MKVFISQPMNGKTNEEILAEREKAIETVTNSLPGATIEVLDSFFKNAPHEAKPLWFLGESIKLLAEADIVFFCKGWSKARGCVIEHNCAIAYGLDAVGYTE